MSALANGWIIWRALQTGKLQGREQSLGQVGWEVTPIKLRHFLSKSSLRWSVLHAPQLILLIGSQLVFDPNSDGQLSPLQVAFEI